jgi:enoyl-[acyl-carrier-protein] reductase (NADH)
MTNEQWHEVIETNLNSLFHVTKQELAARGITVNAVSPGHIATGADFSLNGGLHMS